MDAFTVDPLLTLSIPSNNGLESPYITITRATIGQCHFYFIGEGQQAACQIKRSTDGEPKYGRGKSMVFTQKLFFLFPKTLSIHKHLNRPTPFTVYNAHRYQH